MTDLLTKVGWALRARKENLALDEDLEHLAHDMARALVAAGELADAVAALDKQKPSEGGGRLVLEIDILAALESLAAFRAAMEGRVDDEQGVG
jgi:hypothetical protein